MKYEREEFVESNYRQRSEVTLMNGGVRETKKDKNIST